MGARLARRRSRVVGQSLHHAPPRRLRSEQPAGHAPHPNQRRAAAFLTSCCNFGRLSRERARNEAKRFTRPWCDCAVGQGALAIHPAMPARTLREFIDYAKANPGKLSYGHAGVGSLNHLTGELLKSLAGTPDIVHVPYRGSGPATADAIGGQVAMVTPAVTGGLLEFNRSGKLRILAVTSPNRLIAAPEIPTAVEAGLPGMISQQSIGLFAPSGTPKAII